MPLQENGEPSVFELTKAPDTVGASKRHYGAVEQLKWLAS